jgi:hypothetical protein
MEAGASAQGKLSAGGGAATDVRHVASNVCLFFGGLSTLKPMIVKQSVATKRLLVWQSVSDQEL